MSQNWLFHASLIERSNLISQLFDVSYKRGWLALATLAIALLVPVAYAGAATVTNTNDSGPGSLRQAISDAAPGETINVPAGKYVLSSGQLEFEKSLNIVGAGDGSTTISAANASGIFEIDDFAQEAEVRISGLLLQNGRVSGNGAAIDATAHVLTLRDVVITHNVAESVAVEGGALNFFGQRLTVADSKVVGNRARATDRIFGGAVSATAEALTIERSTIANNSAEVSDEEKGGEIYGAGIFSGLASTLIVDSTISNNAGIASGGSDGGFAQGGGIFVLGGLLSQSLIRDTIVGNSVRTEANGTAQGGGLAVVSFGSESSVDVTSSTIASNSGSGSASVGNGGNVFVGGFFNPIRTHRFDGGVQMSFANTIVSNGAGAPHSENCMIEKRGSEVEPGVQSRLVSHGFNLDSRDQCEFHAAGDIVGRDPLLGALQKNGGPTETLLPAANSPVVDQGTALAMRNDQRGFARPFDFTAVPNSAAVGGDGSDIGAVELQGSSKTAVR
jgi:hypothetical protein